MTGLIRSQMSYLNAEMRETGASEIELYSFILTLDMLFLYMCQIMPK